MKSRVVPQLEDVNLYNWLRQLNIELKGIPMTERTPTSTNDTGNKGDIAYDGTYLYICVDQDTWGRIALDFVF